MTTTFETAKVGDRVYSIRFGWGIIDHFHFDPHDSCRNSFYVEFDSGNTDNYVKSGHMYYYNNYTGGRDLFWGVPEYIAPEKPKRLVKVKRYYNFGRSGNSIYPVGSIEGYDSLEKALRDSTTEKYYLTTKEIEFEIEE